MTSSAFATTSARPAAGRHAGPRHAQEWLTAGRPAHGRHAQDRHAAGTRRAGAFARRFAVSVGAAAMAAIGLPEVG
jgi:hypothetical protein